MLLTRCSPCGTLSNNEGTRVRYADRIDVLAETARHEIQYGHVERPNVIVESIKWAEDGVGFIARLYEAGRSGVSTRVTFGVDVKSVSECNLLEEDRKPLAPADGKLDLTFRPFEIKTLCCTV